MANCYATFRVQPSFIKQQQNYRLKKSGVFLCNKRIIAGESTIHQHSPTIHRHSPTIHRHSPTIHQHSAWEDLLGKLRRKHYWENFKITDHKYRS